MNSLRARGIAGAIIACAMIAAAQAESGAIHNMNGPGWAVQLDTRWVRTTAYRPMRLLLTPTAPTKRDRTLTVSMTTNPRYYRGSELELRQVVDVPAGTSAPVEVFISVPNVEHWDGYSFQVREGNTLVASTNANQGSNLSSADAEGLPAILYIDTVASSTFQLNGLQRLLGLDPNALTHLRPPAQLPTGWINYTGLDLAIISKANLAILIEKHPQRWDAVRRWVFSGGNLVVYGAETNPDGLLDLERMLDFKNAIDSKPGERWQSFQSVGKSSGPLLGLERWNESPQTYDANGNLIVTEPTLPVEEEDSPPVKFLNRRAGLGLVVVTSAEDLAEMSSTGWQSMLDGISPERWQWQKRFGFSQTQENEDFWNFLIPGVGLAPVTSYQVLISLFVIVIGPVNYFLLRKRQKLHLLIFTIPAFALLVTTLLIGYSVIADGLGIRLRARSYTLLDQRQGEAIQWARLCYYCGLTPSNGLTFPDDVAVVALKEMPTSHRYNNSGRNYVYRWDEYPSPAQAQRLESGWLRPRTPTQFATVLSQPSQAKIEVTRSGDGQVQIENQLGTRIEKLLLRDEDGSYYWASGIEAKQQATLEPAVEEDVGLELLQLRAENHPRKPRGFDPNSNRYGRRYYSYSDYSNFGVDSPNSDESILEYRVGDMLPPSRTGPDLPKRTYLAIVQRDPHLATGHEDAELEASLHVIEGRW